MHVCVAWSMCGVVLAVGEEAHYVAIHLSKSIHREEEIVISGYTFDHPTVADEVIAAARLCSNVDLILNRDGVE